MDTTISVFVGLHIIGIASLLGGFLTQLSAARTGEARMVPAMLHGALTMLVTGVIMIGLLRADDRHLDNTKFGVKLAVLVVILVLVYVKRGEKVDRTLFGAVGLLTITNIFIALLWT
jgi:Ca2+/Na+ antiporter